MRVGSICRWLLLGLLMSQAAAAQVIVKAVSETEQSIALNIQFELLEDPTRTLTLAAIRQTNPAATFATSLSNKDGVNLGMSQSALWLRLQVRNDGANTVEQFLEVAYPRLTNLDFYRYVDGREVEAYNVGNSRPFSLRPFPNRYFVFPMTLAPGDSTIYLRVESKSPLEVPATLWASSAFHRHVTDDYIVQAAYFGALGAMLLFNGLLWLFLRERGYGFYVLFVLGNALGQLSGTGLGAQYVWGDSVHWNTVAFGVGATFSFIWMMVFMRHMVGTAVLIPRFDKIFNWLIAANVLLMFSMLFTYSATATVVLVFVSAAVTFVGALRCSLKGERAAHIYLIAFSGLLVGVMLAILRMTGLLPTNVITANSIQVGSAIEMILLSFALADRVNTLRAEKEKAQATSLAAQANMLEAQQQLVVALRTSERSLEALVAERTTELSATVERLHKTQDKLVQSEKLAGLGAIVSAVAHELNTPLGNCLTVASHLEGETAELQKSLATGSIAKSTLDDYIDANVNAVQLLNRGLTKAASLVANFKLVAVDQRGKQRVTFDLKKQIMAAIGQKMHVLKNTPYLLQIEVSEDIEMCSYPQAIEQVATSLIGNAVLHGFDGRDHGLVKLLVSAEKDQISMVFSDDGNGMSEEIRRRVFDPFFTTKLGKGSSGLGMSICYNLVTGPLGGSIEIASAFGEGCRVTVMLPRHAPLTG